MGSVSRGAIALLVVLALSGSVTPVTSVPNWNDSTAGSLSPATSDQRSLQTPSQPPTVDEADPIDRDLMPAETVASRDALQTSDTIYLAQQFERLPDQPGTVRVRLVYTIPDRVRSLQAEVPDDATLTGREGFDRTNATHFRWDSSTRQPELSYELSVNETIDRTGPQAATGRYVYTDTANWSLFERPPTPTSWEATGRTPLTFERHSSTDGPGAAGEWLVFLGDHEVHEQTAYGQQFTLVVPAAANLSESPDEIFDALANASDALRVGDRDERVFMIAAPTDGVDWGVRGLQTGDTDLWVQDTERLDAADSAWLHEYIHSRQSFETTTRTRWFTEASASYYAALLSLEQDAIGFDAFDDRMQIGTWPVYDRVTLSNTSTWVRSPDYYKGALVAGQLDRQLRVASEREQTFQDVFRTMNGDRGRTTQIDFLNALADAGGTDLLNVGQTYTESPANVTSWNRTTHAAVFGQLPARIGYELPPPESDGYRITGPYRNTTTAGDDPIVLVTGEELTIDAVVSNAGGTAGQYDLSMRVNGTTVNETSGRIGASRSTKVPLSHRFPTPGRYVVGIDGATINVTVQRPASARVVGLSVEESQISAGETVPLTATVYNDAPVPGELFVVFTRDFEEVDRVRVTLGPNSTAFVTRQIELPTAGRISLGAGSVRPVDVTVQPARTQTTVRPTVTATATATTEQTTDAPEPSSTTTTGASAPGFGPIVAVLALVLCVLARARCRR